MNITSLSHSGGSLPPIEQARQRAGETARRRAAEKQQLALNIVQDLEERLGIDRRWTPDHPEFQAATAYIDNRKFIRAVETLEGQVVARLFELSKANLMGTCECDTLV